MTVIVVIALLSRLASMLDNQVVHQGPREAVNLQTIMLPMGLFTKT
jgi:hypothetical protein